MWSFVIQQQGKDVDFGKLSLSNYTGSGEPWEVFELGSGVNVLSTLSSTIFSLGQVFSSIVDQQVSTKKKGNPRKLCEKKNQLCVFCPFFYFKELVIHISYIIYVSSYIYYILYFMFLGFHLLLFTLVVKVLLPHFFLWKLWNYKKNVGPESHGSLSYLFVLWKTSRFRGQCQVSCQHKGNFIIPACHTNIIFVFTS